MNDLEEVNITDRPEIKKSVFISCWAGLDKESIPMWNLYANKSKGVRIKLKSPIFKDSVSAQFIAKHNCHIMILKNIDNFIKRQRDFEWVKYLFGPIEVTYTKDTQVKVIKGENELKVDKIGTVKPEHWAFEEEFRFLILANHDWNSQTDCFEIKNEKYFSEMDTEYFDISIDENIFNNIEILMGPGCGQSETIIAQSLIDKFTTGGKVMESKLRKRIRVIR